MQGDYDIEPLDNQNEKTDFLLVKLTEQQKIRRLERLPKPEESKFFTTGSEIATFKTSDINKHKIDLKAEKGKIFVINFWFINCAPCQREIPSLNELVATFKGNESVRFIAIALDDKFSLSNFLKNSPFNYEIVGDGRYFAQRYKVSSYPTHVIIDQEGKVYFHTTGLALNTVHWLKKSIDELLSKSPVTNK
jgi:thiol-disulfide isomerase/thioredoxin